MLRIMWIVYILKSSEEANRYYIGRTRDINKRLKEHNSNECDGYSKRYAPWKLETYITFKKGLLAERFEKYLKAGSGQAFLKKRLI